MQGDAFGADVLAVVGGAAGILFVGWLLTRATHYLRRRRLIACPPHGRDMECIAVEDTATGRVVNIVQCEPFGHGPVTCQKVCIHAQASAPPGRA